MKLKELEKLIAEGVENGAFPGAAYAIVFKDYIYTNCCGYKALYPEKELNDVRGEEEKLEAQWNKLDCEYGRILTSKGVYTCPFLANDYRGRCGSSFVDYNKKSSLETSFCETCISSKKQLFSIDFAMFE